MIKELKNTKVYTCALYQRGFFVKLDDEHVFSLSLLEAKRRCTTLNGPQSAVDTGWRVVSIAGWWSVES